MTLVELVENIHLHKIDNETAIKTYKEMDIFEPTAEKPNVFTKNDDMSWYDVQAKLVHQELPLMTEKDCEQIFNFLTK